jgi:pimeloyl-ACP methyl ester carboxylesterase
MSKDTKDDQDEDYVRPNIPSNYLDHEAAQDPPDITDGSMKMLESQIFTLPDGRILGFAEYGSPKGVPLLWFHGFPSSRLEAWGAHRIARRLGIRVLALDRPGIGLSTFQPGRQIVDWPNNVRDFVDHLGLIRFAIVGGSGGAPYALACAWAMPKEMISAVGLMCPMAPWEAGVQDIPWLARFAATAAYYFPGGLQVVTDAIIGCMRLMSTTGPVTRWADIWLASVKQKAGEVTGLDGGNSASQKDDEQIDKDEVTPEEHRERVINLGFESYKQGSQGVVHEAQILSQDWGFKLEDVKYDGIRIWHGTKDTNSPIGMVRYMAERLPNCTLKEYEGESHYTMSNHLEEIFVELLPDIKSK